MNPPAKSKISSKIFWVTIAFICISLTNILQSLYQTLTGAPALPFAAGAAAGLLIFAGIFLLFKHFLWRFPVLRYLGIVTAPDLSGRWVGFLTSSYQREGQNVVIPIALEIEQNAFCVKVRAYLEDAESDSILADIRIDGEVPRLCYVYDNTFLHRQTRERLTDRGVVSLEYFEKDTRTLKGFYFNDAKPQANHGEIRVSYSSTKNLRELS